MLQSVSSLQLVFIVWCDLSSEREIAVSQLPSNTFSSQQPHLTTSAPHQPAKLSCLSRCCYWRPETLLLSSGLGS